MEREINIYNQKDKKEPEEDDVEEGELDKEKVSILEESGLGCFEKMEFLLVLMDEKKTSTSERYVPFQGSDEEVERYIDTAIEVINRRVKTADDLGFETKLRRYFDIKNGEKVGSHYELIYAKEKSVLDELEEVVEKGIGSEDYHEKIGELLSIPESSVRAFTKGDEHLLSDAEAREKLREVEEGLDNFLNFRMSKDNFEEELKFVKKRAEKIKKNSSKIYREIKESPSLR
ncbi:MAG: hypothetical protein ACQEP3_02660 [Patescibacteria group bacterium]